MDFKDFQDFARKSHTLAFHVWFLIFCGTPRQILQKFCENPSANNLNLNINTRMLVKCYDDMKIREWYATKTKMEIESFHLYNWTLKSGLTLTTKRCAYERRNDFTGIEVKLAAVKEREKVPVMQGNKFQHIDMFQMMLLEVLHHMKFTVKLLPTTDTYGTLNKTTSKWSGLLGEIQAGHVDVPFTEFTVLKDRVTDFDFTWAISQPRNCLFIKEPRVTSFKWKAYLQAFNCDVWIIFIILILAMPVILIYMKRKTEKVATEENDFINNFLYVWGIYCQQGVPYFPRASSLRTITVFLFFSQTILIAIYSAFIVSYLMNPSITLPFNTLSEFVGDGTYKLIILRDSAEVTLFSTSKDPIFSRMSKMLNPPEELPMNSMESFKQICNEDRVAFYADENKAQKVRLKNYSCKLRFIFTNGKRFMAFPLSKYNPLKSFINYYTLRFKENGVMNRMQTTYKQKYDDPVNEFTAVGFREISAALAILSVGFFLSILICLLERMNCNRLSL